MVSGTNTVTQPSQVQLVARFPGATADVPSRAYKSFTSTTLQTTSLENTGMELEMDATFDLAPVESHNCHNQTILQIDAPQPRSPMPTGSKGTPARYDEVWEAIGPTFKHLCNHLGNTLPQTMIIFDLFYNFRRT